MFQRTVLRCSNREIYQNPIVIGSNDHRFLIAEDLAQLEVEADILLEPFQRNSCAAVVAGCLQAQARDENTLVLVLAADHAIEDEAGFSATIKEAMEAANQGYLITFGIKPDFPSTGYGYILPDGNKPIAGGFSVAQFVEKPSESLAKEYLENGYLWNSGNFMFRADSFLKEAEKFVPEIVDAVSNSHRLVKADLDFLRLDEASFERSPSISVDYAIMEKTKKAVAYLAAHDWSDIGTWNSVWRTLQKDERGNAKLGDAIIRDGKNNLVHSKERLTTLIGVKDTVVIVTRDAVLVGDQSHSEQIKDLVENLKGSGREEATTALQVYRPWGNYEQLDNGTCFQVKRITINPHGVLSLQKHEHRAEHWVVVQGKPEITIDGNVQTLEPNQSIYIPLGSVHRLANRTKDPVVIIEVQTGSYLGEDDIIRLEDEYNRDGGDQD